MIERADPATRKRTLFILFVVCAPTLLTFGWLDALKPLLAEHPGVMLVVVVVFSGLMIVPLGLLWRLALRVQQFERFPPPNEKMIRDTRVREGAAALRYASLLKALVVLLALVIAAIPILFFLLLWPLTGA